VRHGHLEAKISRFSALRAEMATLAPPLPTRSFCNERRAKGPFSGPLTVAAFGRAVSVFVIEKVKSVKGPGRVRYPKDCSSLATG
jgi:hypothetical protein